MTGQIIELIFRGGEGVWSCHADTHLLSDRGDTCSTSATWSYRKQDLEEKDQSMNESVNDEAVCTGSVK